MQDNQAKKTFGSLIWSFGERISAQLVSTIVTIILARLLTPEHYGAVSIVTVLIALFNVFVTGGFSTALVQKKEVNDVDFNTAFWLSFATSCVLYSILFVFAPLIASFYDMPLLTNVIRVMGIRLPLSAINGIQQAEIQRSMEFRKFFWATLIGTLISGIVGIGLAFLGTGVWALVFQYLTNVTIDTITLFLIGNWHPKFQFSLKKLKNIWQYGWKVLITQLIYTLQGDIRSLIVGKTFGAADLAYYDQGKKYPALLVNNITASIDKVMLSAYSKQQDERERLKSMLRRSVRTGIYVLAPMLLGFAVVAESFVSVVLTDKWLECVPYMQIFCLSYLTRPLESSCHQILLAVGKSGAVLWCILTINIVGIITIFISVFVFESVLAIALFSLLCTLVSLSVFFLMTNKYVGYTLKQQLQDIFPSIVISLIMSLLVWSTGHLVTNDIVRLILQIITGIVSYVVLSLLFKIEPFRYLCGLIAKIFHINRRNKV